MHLVVKAGVDQGANKRALGRVVALGFAHNLHNLGFHPRQRIVKVFGTLVRVRI